MSWFKVKSAAKYVDMSERTIWNWIKEDGLKHSKHRGTVLIRDRDIDEFLERQTITPHNPDQIGKLVDEICR